MDQTSMYLWGAAILICFLVVTQFSKSPGKLMFKLIKSAVIGCILVLAVNWGGEYLHFHIPFNAITAMTAGLLGVPGVVALITMHLWLFPTL